MTLAGVHDALEAAYRNDSRRVLATLIKLLGGFDEAEEALHEAFVVAAERWPVDGVPANPSAWLVSAGRFKTIDRWRRQARLTRILPDLAALMESAAEPCVPEIIQDDELRLIFICCHPSLAADARCALTLREVGGLTTEEIARAYLVPAPTVAQRIVRAKAKIRDDAIPFELPPRGQLEARLESALQVIYLIFNEGYSALQAESLARGRLCAEAIRLGRTLLELLDEPEALALMSLMLLHDARRVTRADSAGDIVLLEHQDRSLWDRTQIAEAMGLLDRAFASRRVGSYALQAAIAAVHANAGSVDETDWKRVVELYDALRHADPSPVVALNRAVALAMRDGPAAGLLAVDAVMEGGRLDDYALGHAARADMQRRVGDARSARISYRRALDLTRQPAELRFLRRRLDQLDGRCSW